MRSKYSVCYCIVSSVSLEVERVARHFHSPAVPTQLFLVDDRLQLLITSIWRLVRPAAVHLQSYAIKVGYRGMIVVVPGPTLVRIELFSGPVASTARGRVIRGFRVSVGVSP